MHGILPEVTMQQGDETSRFETATFCTRLSKTSFMTLHSFSYFNRSSSCFFCSSSDTGSSRPSFVTDTSFLPEKLIFVI